MKKFKFYLYSWVLLVAVFNLVVFISPDKAGNYYKFGGAFWGGYVSIMLAFVIHLLVSLHVFSAENLQKLFYKIPLIRISRIGFVCIFIFGTLFMVVPNLPNWLGIVVCYFILLLTIISVVKADAAGEIVADIDATVKKKTLFIKDLTADALNLMNSVSDRKVKEDCNKVYEALRYSDPVSSPELKDIEEKINTYYNNFKKDVQKNTRTDGLQELLSLISERNEQCKKLK